MIAAGFARRAAPFALVMFAALSACDDGGGRDAARPAALQNESIAVTGTRAEMAEADFAANAPAPAPAPPPPPPPGQADPQPDPEPVAGMLLAYSYRVGFELPLDNVALLKARHEAECMAAGPRVCLVLGGNVSGDGENFMYGNLSIRAEPQWLEQFRDGLADDAGEAGGRINETSVSTEDLTRNIVDTEARLEAQETLRDRLMVLLQRPTDEVGDLLAVERELARVQGQIDSARSQLNVMRSRVDMSRLDLNYQSRPRAVSTGAFEPVARALTNFLSTLAGSLAVVITIIAAAIPFVLILIPLGMLTWRWYRRRRGKKAA